MALKFIEQDAKTLLQAYEERKAEYEALRATNRWSGAILYAGTLLELALKLAIVSFWEFQIFPQFFKFTISICCSIAAVNKIVLGPALLYTKIFRSSKTIGQWRCVIKAPLKRNKTLMIVITHSLILRMAY